MKLRGRHAQRRSECRDVIVSFVELLAFATPFHEPPLRSFTSEIDSYDERFRSRKRPLEATATGVLIHRPA
jgi:hypothetical protein